MELRPPVSRVIWPQLSTHEEPLGMNRFSPWIPRLSCQSRLVYQSCLSLRSVWKLNIWHRPYIVHLFWWQVLSQHLRGAGPRWCGTSPASFEVVAGKFNCDLFGWSEPGCHKVLEPWMNMVTSHSLAGRLVLSWMLESRSKGKNQTRGTQTKEKHEKRNKNKKQPESMGKTKNKYRKEHFKSKNRNKRDKKLKRKTTKGTKQKTTRKPVGKNKDKLQKPLQAADCCSCIFLELLILWNRYLLIFLIRCSIASQDVPTSLCSHSQYSTSCTGKARRYHGCFQK